MPSSLAQRSVPHRSERESESELVARFAAGCDAAFAEVVAQHQDWLAQLARRLLGYHGPTEDIVQEVFLAALKHRRRFRGDSGLRTYLTRIAVNKCRSYQRKALLRKALFRSGTPVEPVVETDAVLAAERARLVRAAVQRLPGKHREVVVLRYLEELEIAEIAAVLKVKRAVVDMRLNRARGRLRELLGDEV